MSRAERTLRILGVAAATALLAAACGAGATPEGNDGDALVVVAGFYPLEHVVEQVAGNRVELSTLTGPGVDPHSLELSPQAVASVGRADLGNR